MTQSFGIFEDSFNGNVMLLYYQYLRWVILLPVVTSKFSHKMKAEEDRRCRISLSIFSTRTLGVYSTKLKRLSSSTSYSCFGLQFVLYKLIIMFLQILCICLRAGTAGAVEGCTITAKAVHYMYIAINVVNKS